MARPTVPRPFNSDAVAKLSPFDNLHNLAPINPPRVLPKIPNATNDINRNMVVSND